MNQDGRPIINQLNNGVINAPNAMPLKNLTSNNEQSFELDRKLFKKSYNPTTNFAIPQISRSVVQRSAPALQHGVIIDGPKTSAQKKWIGGNRDASKVTMHQRRRATGTALNTTGPQSFNTTSDNNVRIDALARVRGGGYTVPPKVTGRIINFNLPTPSGPPVDPNKYYRIIAAGLQSYQLGTVFSATGFTPGFYNYSGTNMTPLATTSNSLFQRSYNVMTINRTTGLTNTQSFDVFEALPGKGGITTITSYLNELTTEVIVVVATFDEPQTCAITDINNNKTLGNPLTGDFITAMKRCGASSNFGSSTGTPAGFINYRSSYLLVGIPGIGVGNGIQRYVGGNNVTYPAGDPNAFIDLRISVLNGQYTVVSG
jgi:hypothetical protein